MPENGPYPSGSRLSRDGDGDGYYDDDGYHYRRFHSVVPILPSSLQPNSPSSHSPSRVLATSCPEPARLVPVPTRPNSTEWESTATRCIRTWQNTTTNSTSRISVVRVANEGTNAASRSRTDGFFGGARNAMKNGDSGVLGDDGVTIIDGRRDFSDAGSVRSATRSMFVTPTQTLHSLSGAGMSV